MVICCVLVAAYQQARRARAHQSQPAGHLLFGSELGPRDYRAQLAHDNMGERREGNKFPSGGQPHGSR